MFSFWLAHLQNLLIWFSNVSFDSIGILRSSSISSESMQFLLIFAIALLFPEIKRWLLSLVTFIKLLLSHLERIENVCSSLLMPISLNWQVWYCPLNFLYLWLRESRTNHKEKYWIAMALELIPVGPPYINSCNKLCAHLLLPFAFYRAGNRMWSKKCIWKTVKDFW